MAEPQCPDMGPYIILDVSPKLFCEWDEHLHQWTLSEADCPPQCGRASSNQLKPSSEWKPIFPEPKRNSASGWSLGFNCNLSSSLGSSAWISETCTPTIAWANSLKWISLHTYTSDWPRSSHVSHFSVCPDAIGRSSQRSCPLSRGRILESTVGRWQDSPDCSWSGRWGPILGVTPVSRAASSACPPHPNPTPYLLVSRDPSWKMQTHREPREPGKPFRTTADCSETR